MGQKVHPEAMRVGYIHDWKSNWFNSRNFAEYLAEDVRIREYITEKLSHAGLSEITIRKDSGELEVNIHTARVLADRSEEHTSELQSRQYLVCRLLLEKKKKNHK